ncbi:hypothetical protein BDR07DRAFT_1386480 [Suillus spraguei]|nr:hypothetical protein BDR07DRAFT_1386480 [Suillus spraguei]
MTQPQPQPKTNTAQPIGGTPPPRVRRVAVMTVTRLLNQTGPKRATKKTKMKRAHRCNNPVNTWSEIDDTWDDRDANIRRAALKDKAILKAWYEACKRNTWRVADEDDEVEIVEPAAKKAHTGNERAADEDDEVIIVELPPEMRRKRRKGG